MSIGQTLSAARRQAGLTVDDLSAKTRLRATVVRAIENDDFSLCGGDFYARGHIRTLARLVGADADALLAEYDETVANPDDIPAASQVFESETTGQSLTKRTARRAPNWGAAALAAALVAVIAYAGVQLSHGGQNNATSIAAGSTSQPPASSPAPEVTTVAPTDTPTLTPGAGVTSQTAPPSSAVAEAGVHIVITVNAKCWVLASASNGAVLYQGTLQPGDTKTWSDSQKISLKLGNAPATDLVVNGVDIGAPPSTTSVASVSFGPGDPTAGQG
jgi:cytoskeleton protein RodZ